jgi:dCMP deaminase
MCKRMIINAGIKDVIIRIDENQFKTINVSDWIENDESVDGTFGY